MKKIISISLILMISGSLLAEDAITINETGNVVIQNTVEMQSIVEMKDLVKIQYNKDGKGNVALTLQDILRQLTPPGSIQPYGGTTAPEGWLLCNGDSVSEDDYPDLFDVIGTSFGTDGSGNFNLPDLRGMFLRGVSDETGIDPDAASRTALKTGGAVGDNVGSYQGHMLQNHSHYVPSASDDHAHSPYNVAQGGDGGGYYIQSLGYGTSGTFGSETRPKNVTVNYIIKY